MKEIKPKYDFKEVEEGKYDFWLQGGFFTAGDLTKKPYTIVIPPPNVTGKLHLGHAWDTTLQDILVRRKRMKGFDFCAKRKRCHTTSLILLALYLVENLLAIVVTAFLANTISKVHFATVGALRHRGSLQLPHAGASGIFTSLRCFCLWYCHCCNLL